MKDKSGRNIRSLKRQSAGVLNITDLDPFTFYSVSVEVVNDRNLSNTAVKNILTAETCKSLDTFKKCSSYCDGKTRYLCVNTYKAGACIAVASV